MNGLLLTDKSKTSVYIMLIILVVFICYSPVLSNQFVGDDNVNYIENLNYRGLSPSHLKWMFTTFHDANYHPLAWVSLGFDFLMWGMNPAGYHLSNLLLHVMNAVLFYFLVAAFLRHRTEDLDTDASALKVSALVGALFFAVHPLRVETVAWVSTRGDLLCGFFYLLTIIAYVRMVEGKADAEKRKWYWVSLLCFVMSLLSRAWGVTLPVVLLILDIYPLRRSQYSGRTISPPKQLLLEKIPFAVLSLGAAMAALGAKKGSMHALAEHGVLDRLMQAAYGLCFYLWKTVMPVRMSSFYLLDKHFNAVAPKFILCAGVVLGMTAALLIMRHRWPWAITAWACYAVIVSPLLGFVQSGPQIVADRYTYIAGMPFAVLAGAGMLKLWIAWCRQSRSAMPGAATLAMILTGLLGLSILSYHQSRLWYDDHTLLSHVIKLDPQNSFAYYYRGVARQKNGDFKGAFADYTTAIRLDPSHAKAYNNRGSLREIQGDLAGALEDFSSAIRLEPASPEAYANRGVVRQAQKKMDGAVRDLNKALEVASRSWVYRSKVEKLLADIRMQMQSKDNAPDKKRESPADTGSLLPRNGL